MLTKPIYHNREVSEYDITPEESKDAGMICILIGLIAFLAVGGSVIMAIIQSKNP